MKLKAGSGYWDCTRYPIGGSFHRVGPEGLEMPLIEPIDPKGNRYACDRLGTTADGRRIAFQSSLLESSNEG